ncbi:MAG TPA: hypothetical protein VMW17_04245 [Candidatus Binatia bacterium]|nr:hypothetical protein [Candidatus Binatia bacterium]
MESEPIDILKELTDLSAQEDLLAFFEFTHTAAGAPPLSGLCKVSRPQHPGRSHYLSLTFVVDTPNRDARQWIAAILNRLATDELRHALPQVTEVIPMPSVSSSADNYVQQTDLLLADGLDAGQFFVTERLVPAISRVAQLVPTELVWWGEAESKAPVSPVADESESSLAARLRKYWRGAR